MSVLVMAAWLLTTLILGACLYRAIFAVAYIVLDGKVSDDSSLPLIRFAAVIPAPGKNPDSWRLEPASE